MTGKKGRKGRLIYFNSRTDWQRALRQIKKCFPVCFLNYETRLVIFAQSPDCKGIRCLKMQRTLDNCPAPDSQRAQEQMQRCPDHLNKVARIGYFLSEIGEGAERV